MELVGKEKKTFAVTGQVGRSSGRSGPGSVNMRSSQRQPPRCCCYSSAKPPPKRARPFCLAGIWERRWGYEYFLLFFITIFHTRYPRQFRRRPARSNGSRFAQHCWSGNGIRRPWLAYSFVLHTCGPVSLLNLALVVRLVLLPVKLSPFASWMSPAVARASWMSPAVARVKRPFSRKRGRGGPVWLSLLCGSVGL